MRFPSGPGVGDPPSGHPFPETDPGPESARSGMVAEATPTARTSSRSGPLALALQNNLEGVDYFVRRGSRASRRPSPT